MKSPASDLTARNRRTIAAYDAYAPKYAEATAPGRSGFGSEALDRFTACVSPSGQVLEVASGPGWDADVLEAKGLIVRRTDLSDGFIAFQAERGKVVERLDLVSDELSGPWDGIVALYVIQHIERSLVDGVIARIAAALKSKGALLFSFQEGNGEIVQRGVDGGEYHVVRWRYGEMIERLKTHGFDPVWRRRDKDEEGLWTTLIARRS